MSGCTEKQFFYPDQHEYSNLAELGEGAEFVTFPSQDGKLQLHGCFIPARGKVVGTLIQSHGNAQNLTSHVMLVKDFTRHGFNVFVFDYRGFGKSTGVPTLPGALADCHAALDYVLSRPDIDQEKIVWLGQSLGGAFAVLLAAERPEIKALALDSAFSGFTKIVADKMKSTVILWPLSWTAPMLISPMDDPLDRIAELSPRPLMIVYGTNDRVVPSYMSEELFEKAGQPKERMILPNARHLQALGSYNSQVQPWLAKHFTLALQPLPEND